MDTDYWHSLDRKSAQDVGISPDFISVSTHPFKEQLDELKAKIFSGTKNVELSFIATGSGSRAQGQPVPEHYGKEEREELRQLAKINEIELSVHSPANAPAASGFSREGFSPEVKAESLKELKRTIEFAADVARGGPITVHMWEFERPIFEAGEKLEGYEKEREKAPIYFVDSKSGKIEGFSRDAEIPIPKGGFENPERDENGHIKEWVKKKVSDFEKEAKAKNEPNVAKYILENVEKRNLEFKKIEMDDYYSQAKKVEREYDFIHNLTKKLDEQAKTNKDAANYNAFTWVERFEEERREKLTPRDASEEYKDFLKNPIKYLKEIEDRTKNSMKAAFEAADARKYEIEEKQRALERIKPIKEYALEQTADTVSEGALYALNLEKEMKKKGAEFDRPIVISPENVGGHLSKLYGSTPEELKTIIQKTREAFVNKLVSRNLADKNEAEKIAEERIKATFDIGHMNTWRQYFKGSEKEFKDWVLKEVDKLSKSKMLGHVHINDNFGYEDIHISPGQGNAPIKEFVDQITKEGFKGKMVIEAGNQRGGEGWQVLPEAWRTLNSPIYRIDSLYGTWSDIRGSYFGNTGSPTYLVGDTVPSKEWTLWSETQLE